MIPILLAILTTFIATALVTILALNLRSGEKQIGYLLDHVFGVDDPQFLRCMGRLLGPGILGGNKIVALHNGDEIFPAMLHAIRSAQKSITFETYIYWSGEIGREFADALCERARAGVVNSDPGFFALPRERGLRWFRSPFEGHGSGTMSVRFSSPPERGK